jgi:hypothetical protein
MKLLYQNQNIPLPDFLLIGAARSGTSSLYFYLREHPEIFMPEFKEPHFFSFLGKESPHPDLPPWKLEDYLRLFHPANPKQHLGEASSSYIYYYIESIRNIKVIYGDRYPEVKIISILRNPIDRAWSYFMLRRRTGHEKDFFEVIEDLKIHADEKLFHDFILSGMYYEQIRAYQETFNSVKILFFEELEEDIGSLIKDLNRFLDLDDKEFVPGNIDKAYNASGTPKNKVFQPVYDMLFNVNNFKNVIKPLIPYSLRQNIKTEIGKRIMKKSEPPRDVREYLCKQFESNLRSLMTIIDDNNQKKIIQSWLN